MLTPPVDDNAELRAAAAKRSKRWFWPAMIFLFLCLAPPFIIMWYQVLTR